MGKNKIKNYSGRNFKKKRETDKITKSERSLLMSKIRSRDTKFEEDFIGELSKRIKIKFKRNYQLIRGKPDIVFGRQRACVFLDSDFWHGWQYPRWKHLLKNDFWRDKIERNRDRDKNITVYLRKCGWKVVRVWEHLIRKDKKCQMNRILKVLQL